MSALNVDVVVIYVKLYVKKKSVPKPCGNYTFNATVVEMGGKLIHFKLVANIYTLTYRLRCSFECKRPLVHVVLL